METLLNMLQLLAVAGAIRGAAWLFKKFAKLLRGEP